MESLRRLDTDYTASERTVSRPELTPRSKSRPLLFERHLSEQGRSRINGPLSPGSPNTPRSPHTPFLGRSLSSNFNSPGLNFRVDEDNFVFEFGSRCLRAGIGGEKDPRCQLTFTPELGRRVGDHRQWLRDSHATPHNAQNQESWGRAFELWNMDLRKCDLGVVEDRVEAMVRKAIREHILIVDDSRKRRFVLALPPILPRALLSLLLTKIFNLYPSPVSLTLLSSPLLCAVSAGVRSSLVIDIGWNETVVSALYEYREIQHRRSSRGMRLLTWEMKEMLKSALAYSMSGEDDESAEVSFQEVEEVIIKLGWCQVLDEISSSSDNIISLSLNSPDPPTTINLPRSSFSIPIEQTFLETQSSQYYDDHDLPLPQLIYESLLSLSIDIRHEVIPRIILTGGGSEITGLQQRLLQEVNKIIESRRWDPVRNYGSAALPKKRDHALITRERKAPQRSESEEHPVNKDFDEDSTTPAYLQPPLPDPILAAIKARAIQTPIMGPPGESNRNSLTDSVADGYSTIEAESHAPELRSVKSLGPWAGASLVSGLKIRGLVEIERERFLSHGLSGADRDEGNKWHSIELANHQPPRQGIAGQSNSMFGKSNDRESASWTLGIWA